MFVLKNLSVIRCENIVLFSALHLAVKCGRQQLVSDLLELIKQSPPAEPAVIDRCTYFDKRVSDRSKCNKMNIGNEYRTKCNKAKNSLMKIVLWTKYM